jgi:hypothetical protein
MFPFNCYKLLNIKNLGLDCYLASKATELPAASAEILPIAGKNSSSWLRKFIIL